MLDNRRMTLEEISKEIDISRTTIYKVVNGKGYVSEKTKNIILDALKKYNYSQNKNARNLALNKDYRIGCSILKSKSAIYFSSTIKLGFMQAQNEFGDHGLKLLIYESEIENPQKQLEDIDKLYQQGIRSFVIVSIDNKAVAEKIKWLKKNKCVVVTLSRDVEDAPRDSYVGVDYYKSGLLAAEVCGKILRNGKLQILVSHEIDTNNDIKMRYEGFCAGIKNYKNINLAETKFGYDSGEKVYNDVVDLLHSETINIDGIFDLTYKLEEISKALIATKKEDVVLIGFDLFAEINVFLKKSIIDAIIFQDLKGQAYLAIKILFDGLCYGEKTTKTKHFSRLDIIMANNLEYFEEEYNIK